MSRIPGQHRFLKCRKCGERKPRGAFENPQTRNPNGGPPYGRNVCRTCPPVSASLSKPFGVFTLNCYRYHKGGEYVVIELTGATGAKVAETLVSLVDLPRVIAAGRWVKSTPTKGRALFYAALSRSNIRLHRFIMDPPANLVVDHINGDGLDNRRENLRICTQTENMKNTPKTRAARCEARL